MQEVLIIIFPISSSFIWGIAVVWHVPRARRVKKEMNEAKFVAELDKI